MPKARRFEDAPARTLFSISMPTERLAGTCAGRI